MSFAPEIGAERTSLCTALVVELVFHLCIKYLTPHIYWLEKSKASEQNPRLQLEFFVALGFSQLINVIRSGSGIYCTLTMIHGE